MSRCRKAAPVAVAFLLGVVSVFMDSRSDGSCSERECDSSLCWRVTTNPPGGACISYDAEQAEWDYSDMPIGGAQYPTGHTVDGYFRQACTAECLANYGVAACTGWSTESFSTNQMQCVPY